MDVALFFAYLGVCAVIGVLLSTKVRPWLAQRRLEREAEADLIANMKYEAAQKKAADKILRRNGQKP